MDSTVFRLPASLATAFPVWRGWTKACAKVQFELTCWVGAIKHLSLEHARHSDKAYAGNRQPLDSGELILRDLVIIH